MAFEVGDRVVVNDPVNIFYHDREAVVVNVHDEYVDIAGLIYTVAVGNVEFVVKEEKLK